MANSPPADEANALPNARTRTRASRRTTSIPDRLGLIAQEDADVPFKDFPGDAQSYDYHVRHKLFTRKDANFKFPPIINFCHHASKMTGARKNKLCLCEVDRGWTSNAQEIDGPIPILEVEDIVEEGDIEIDNNRGLGGPMPILEVEDILEEEDIEIPNNRDIGGPIVQDCVFNMELSDTMDQSTSADALGTSKQGHDVISSNASDAQLSCDNSAMANYEGPRADMTGSDNANNAINARVSDSNESLSIIRGYDRPINSTVNTASTTATTIEAIYTTTTTTTTTADTESTATTTVTVATTTAAIGSAGPTAGRRATAVRDSAGDGEPRKQRCTVPPPHGNAGIGGQRPAGTESVHIGQESHRDQSLLRREVDATTTTFQPQSPLDLLRPILVSAEPGAIGDDQNTGGIRNGLITFDPGITPRLSREINMAGALKEGKPAGALVPYISVYDISIGGTAPIAGNRSIFFDNAAKKFYHVLWTAEGNDATTGEVIPAGWQVYSICPITDKENPLYETTRTSDDTSLATVLSGMLQLQSAERKERLEKAEKDREKQEALERRDYSALYSRTADPLGEREAFTPAGMAATQTRELMKHFIPWGETEKKGGLEFDLWYDRITAAVKIIGAEDYFGVSLENLKLTLLNAIKHPMARKIEDISLADPTVKAMNVTDFLKMIRKRFKPDVDCFNSEADFRAYRQVAGQAPVMYFQKKLLLFKSAYSTWRSENMRKFLIPLCNGLINNDLAVKLQEKVLLATPAINSMDELRELLEIMVSVQKQNVSAGRLTGDSGKGLHSEASDTEGRSAGRATSGSGKKSFRVNEVEWEEEEDGPPDVSECIFISELEGCQILHLQDDLQQEFELHAVATKWGTAKTCYGCGSEGHFLRDCQDEAAVQKYKTERKKNAPPKGAKTRGGSRGRGGAGGRGRGNRGRGNSNPSRGTPATSSLLSTVNELGVDGEDDPDEHFGRDQ